MSSAEIRLEARMKARADAQAAEKLRREADALFSAGRGEEAEALYRQAKDLDQSCDQHCAAAAAVRVTS